ncbi:MAG: hypothetical protein WBA46_18505 [Thermomicrobiales bacterium]
MIDTDYGTLEEPEVSWSDEEWTRASRHTYTVWWSDQDELYLARCVEYPAAESHGRTPEDAVHGAIDAVAVVLDAEVQPKPSSAGVLRNYTSKDVAEILGVSVRRVQALAKRLQVGELKGKALHFGDRDIAAMQPGTPGRRWDAGNRAVTRFRQDFPGIDIQVVPAMRVVADGVEPTGRWIIIVHGDVDRETFDFNVDDPISGYDDAATTIRERIAALTH